MPNGIFDQQLEIALVISVREEDIFPAVSPLGEMVGKAWDYHSGHSWHMEYSPNNWVEQSRRSATRSRLVILYGPSHSYLTAEEQIERNNVRIPLCSHPAAGCKFPWSERWMIPDDIFFSFDVCFVSASQAYASGVHQIMRRRKMVLLRDK